MRIVSQLCLLVLGSFVAGEQAYNNNGDDGYNQGGANGDDAVGDDDAANRYYYSNLNQNKGYFSAGDEYIKYWTDYAILPKACIV
jgi:hypothetical protein